ncbi:MAG: 3-deoxy-manno-octulosonate cytidylyltransferase [Oligoflexales bacterium]
MSNWLIVIPARLNSQRLPSKPLALVDGQPLIIRVYENLKPLLSKAHIVVATDSSDIKELCEAHHVTVMMTRADHPSGTDRCHEVAMQRNEPWVLNVQGDEPFINPEDLESLMEAMQQNPKSEMGTLVHETQDEKKIQSPHVVKVVRNQNDFAMYFSRSVIPHHASSALEHIGVYAFRRETLMRFHNLPVSKHEKIERLEQLRALDHGISLLTVNASQPSMGIDTYEELEQATEWFRHHRPYSTNDS